MDIDYIVTLSYGDNSPEPGEPTPTEGDVARAVMQGLEELGFPSVDVSVERQ